MAPILGYWNVRGIAEPIRYLMAYTGTKCEYCDYVTGDAPDYDKSGWFSVKETLGLPFPNLPYYIDGDVKLTQTTAIIRHIARKHNLCGTSEEEMMRADVIAAEEGGREAYLNSCKAFLQRHSDFLSTYPYFTGDHVSILWYIFLIIPYSLNPC
ncbi:hypothetical protein pdam_00015777 [Pocillopora damicornis]|uniref:glutathione transferase n=1 Tax=Pocillopora damicornis TaxID=46731 RepID=A0A3M6USY3_POCDA|nr:hypothetical protein pdam_00015777 [Pocillopora damicornis]